MAYGPEKMDQVHLVAAPPSTCAGQWGRRAFKRQSAFGVPPAEPGTSFPACRRSVGGSGRRVDRPDHEWDRGASSTLSQRVSRGLPVCPGYRSMRKIASAGYRFRFRPPWYRVVWPEGAGWPVLHGAERTEREFGGHASAQTSRRNGRARNARRRKGSPSNTLHVASQFFLSVPRRATCHYTEAESFCWNSSGRGRPAGSKQDKLRRRGRLMLQSAGGRRVNHGCGRLPRDANSYRQGRTMLGKTKGPVLATAFRQLLPAIRIRTRGGSRNSSESSQILAA